jgi:Ca-activated chloride channel homolog
MKIPPRLSAFLLILNLSSPAWTQSSAPEADGSKQATVTLSFFVVDSHGAPNTDFSKEDLAILDSKQYTATAQNLYVPKSMPLRVGVLIDTSNSMAHSSLYGARVQGAVNFLQEIINGTSGRGFIVGFSAVAQASPFMTNDELLRLKLSLTTGGGTALYDAINLACLDRMKSDPVYPARRLLLVLSDGDDNLSHVDLNRAIAAAQQTETVVFALDTGRYPSNDKGRRVLEQIADQTGGRVFDGLSQKDLAKAFAEIKEEIRNMYSVTFNPVEPAKSGGGRSIVLKAAKDSSLKIRAPKGYYGDGPTP